MSICSLPLIHQYKVCMSHYILSIDDNNRIVLQPTEGLSDCQNDYINACYINVSDFLNDAMILCICSSHAGI